MPHKLHRVVLGMISIYLFIGFYACTDSNDGDSVGRAEIPDQAGRPALSVSEEVSSDLVVRFNYLKEELYYESIITGVIIADTQGNGKKYSVAYDEIVDAESGESSPGLSKSLEIIYFKDASIDIYQTLLLSPSLIPKGSTSEIRSSDSHFAHRIYPDRTFKLFPPSKNLGIGSLYEIPNVDTLLREIPTMRLSGLLEESKRQKQFSAEVIRDKENHITSALFRFDDGHSVTAKASGWSTGEFSEPSHLRVDTFNQQGKKTHTEIWGPIQ